MGLNFEISCVLDTVQYLSRLPIAYKIEDSVPSPHLPVTSIETLTKTEVVTSDWGIVVIAQTVILFGVIWTLDIRVKAKF